MAKTEKYNLPHEEMENEVQHPESFTIKEFVEREAGLKSKNWLTSILLFLFYPMSGNLIGNKYYKYLKYWHWYIVAGIIIWLPFSVDFTTAMIDILCWFIMWFVYKTIKAFIKGLISD
jgi:hypothetical protein